RTRRGYFLARAPGEADPGGHGRPLPLPGGGRPGNRTGSGRKHRLREGRPTLARSRGGSGRGAHRGKPRDRGNDLVRGGRRGVVTSEPAKPRGRRSGPPRDSAVVQIPASIRSAKLLPGRLYPRTSK